MLYIQLNDAGFADESGYLRCHICHPETREYIGPSDEFISQNTGLPAWAFLDGPPVDAQVGHVWVRDNQAWVEIEDHRGEIVYDTMTKECSEISVLGPIPDGKTDQQPNSPHDRWSGTSWVKDEDAEHQAKLDSAKTEQSMRIAEANLNISIIKPAVDGGYAKPEHTQLLSDWQRYCYDLTLVPEQPCWPEEPQWPEKPASVV